MPKPKTKPKRTSTKFPECLSNHESVLSKLPKTKSAPEMVLVPKDALCGVAFALCIHAFDPPHKDAEFYLARLPEIYSNNDVLKSIKRAIVAQEGKER